MKCKVWNCRRNKEKDNHLKFFRFPKNPEIRAGWIRRCVRSEKDLPLFIVKNSSRVCSEHFPNGKKNDDKTINLPVVFAPEEPEVEELNDLSEEMEEPVVEPTPKIEVDMSVTGNAHNEYCRVCMRIVAASILHKINKEVRRKLRVVFTLDFPLKNPDILICTNCVNLMDICINFHRAVSKAHELQSRLNQKLRLECNDFWNNLEHVQIISRCKDIVQHHTKAIDALCEADLGLSNEQPEELPTQDIGQAELHKTINTILAEPEITLNEFEPKQEIIEITPVKCEMVSNSEEEESTSCEDNYFDNQAYSYKPPTKNIHIKKPDKKPRLPQEKKEKKQKLPSEHKIAFFKRHKLPTPVYVSTLCDICGTYSDRNTAERHKNKHLGLKPYACDFPECTSTFYGRKDLFIHKRRMHISPRIRDCHLCDRKIRGDDWTFRTHLNTHTEREKSFRCECCGKSFLLAKSLKRHSCLQVA